MVCLDSRAAFHVQMRAVKSRARALCQPLSEGERWLAGYHDCFCCETILKLALFNVGSDVSNTYPTYSDMHKVNPAA
jgi:hypothetical protein